MEPRQIVAALERNAGPMVVETARPTVFLLPGLYGDDLRVATLRLALESRIRFVLIEYPDWPDMAAAESAGEAVIAAATDQILAAAPPGPIALLGYSYGGRVAEKVARRLLQMGRSVGLIGIIDTDLSFRRRRAPQRLALKLRHFRQEIAGSFAFGSFAGVAGFAAARLAHDLIGLQNARRTASVWRPLLPDRSVLVLDRWLQMVLRLAAAAEWVARPDPAPLPVPTILFRSDDHEPDAPDDLGWSRRCPRLEILRLGGDHETMLDRPHRDPLCERLVAALQQAGPAASGMTATAA
jgi:phthiocerol/phenolphthiocerol synthesis type-I polyketide synthase D